MTPALLLMCEYLMRCPINSGQDAARGSFLCSLVFSVGVRSLFLNWSNLKLLACVAALVCINITFFLPKVLGGVVRKAFFFFFL